MQFYMKNMGRITGPYTAKELSTMQFDDDVLVSEQSFCKEWVNIDTIDIEKALQQEALEEKEFAITNSGDNIADMQDYIDKLYEYAADRMINYGISAAKVKQELIDKGTSEEDASKIVSELSAEIKKESKTEKTDGVTEMIVGLLFFVGGIVATVISFNSKGIYHYIFYGAVITGIVSFFRGLIKTLS